MVSSSSSSPMADLPTLRPPFPPLPDAGGKTPGRGCGRLAALLSPAPGSSTYRPFKTVIGCGVPVSDGL
eukprot:48701-Eustigmatos_ZCMA.PRE.1